MKKFLLLIAGFAFCAGSYAQTNATDFTSSDCGGTSHSLFSEMDAGKIIVIGWTMPCASCAPPLLDVHNTILNYAISNPGVVEYWVTDDEGTTACATIEGWCNTNGITNAFYFSDPNINMMDYGGPGMPKVVVLGCTDHKVYYNRNNSFTGAQVATAIDAALADMAGGCVTPDAISELDGSFSLEVFPNPAATSLNVSFARINASELNMEVYNVSGVLLEQISLEGVESNTQIDISDLADGIYFVKVIGNDGSEVKRFQVAH